MSLLDKFQFHYSAGFGSPRFGGYYTLLHTPFHSFRRVVSGLLTYVLSLLYVFDQYPVKLVAPAWLCLSLPRS